MIECDKIQEILPAYLEGLASPSESEMVASHLASCQDCALSVKALMKCQRLIGNLEEVEPPPWLKTKIMARLEEEVMEEEEQTGWNLGRLKDLLLYPLKIKIPIQVFTVLLVAVAVIYVYRSIQPDVKLVSQAPKVAPALEEKQNNFPKATSQFKGEERTVRGEQPQEAQKAADARGVEKPGPDVRELLRSGPPQPSSPPAARMAQEMKDQAAQAAPEPEGKRTKSAKALLSAVPGTSAPSEEQDRIEQKAEAEKGKVVGGARQETVALSVQVNDLKTGSKDVEGVLRDLNAPVARESREGSTLINTEVPLQRAKEIIKRLNAVGHVQQKSQLPDTPGDKNVSVKIQVLQKQQ